MKRSRTVTVQDKAREIAFFDRHAEADEYNVFAPETTRDIVDRFVGFCGLRPGDRVLDLGCGSGIFASHLAQRGVVVAGVDLSHRLLARGKQAAPSVGFVTGDAEHLPFASGSFAGVLLSGIIHHLPDPRQMARETHRVLRPGGRFMAFDPNRRNPAMWAYRDWDSPFYSNVGVTENERPLLAEDVRRTFAAAGFRVLTDYFTAKYRYVASGAVRWVLPLYNVVEAVALAPRPLRRFRAIVLSYGIRE